MKKRTILKTGKKASSSKQGIEKDIDELVHSQEQERLPGKESIEEDPDDLVHREHEEDE